MKEKKVLVGRSPIRYKNIDITTKSLICCLCNKPIVANSDGWDKGNNPDPLGKSQFGERCCDSCNDSQVMKARLKLVT